MPVLWEEYPLLTAPVFSFLLISKSSEYARPSPKPPAVTALPGVPHRNLGVALPALSVPGLLGRSPVSLPRPAPGFVPSTEHQPRLLRGGLRWEPAAPHWGPAAFA